MSKRIFGTSLRGWRHIIVWTIGGTVGCVLFSVFFIAAVFSYMPAEPYSLGLLVGIILPTILAGPLFFYLTYKMRELAKVNYRLHAMATEDGLTGLYNRTAIIERVERHVMSRQDADALAGRTDLFIVVDADNFKQINDRFGHAEGDRALQLIASTLRDSVRTYDLVGRIGGEEFALLLPGVSRTDAGYVVDRIRRAVNSITFSPLGTRIDLSVSIGGVLCAQRHTFADMFRAADSNLYKAKADGRNCSVITLYGEHFKPQKRAEDLDGIVQSIAKARRFIDDVPAMDAGLAGHAGRPAVAN